MTLFDRLFTGRPLVAQLGIAAALLVMLIAAAVLLPRSLRLTASGPQAVYQAALAATEGVVLSYDLPGGSEQVDLRADLAALREALAQQLPEGVQFDTRVRLEVRREKRDGGAEQETHVGTLMLLLSGSDAAAVTAANQAVAKHMPGLGEPKLQDATWFRAIGGGIEGGIDIKLGSEGQEHVFNFPEGTSAEQIKREINEWLAANMPGKTFDVQVDVEESGSGDEKTKRVEIRIEGEGHADD
jgi:hypothetical protein